jgi:hypothetical protein
MRKPTHSQIAALAYKLYVEDGKPEGEAESHWHRAVEILNHPETYSDDNVLSPPSEPEINRALDAKAQDLDTGLPSDPHSGSNAFHQRIEVAVDSRDKKKAARMKQALSSLKGIERVQPGGAGETMQIFFDARRTNPAAIHEALSGSRDDEEAVSTLSDERD